MQDSADKSALHRARRIGEQAAEVGFDWENAQGPLEKISEELRELIEAMAGGDKDEIQSELGDLLFAATSLARHLDVDPESALLGTCARFNRRFEWVQNALQAQGRTVSETSAEDLDVLWQAAKKS